MPCRVECVHNLWCVHIYCVVYTDVFTLLLFSLKSEIDDRVCPSPRRAPRPRSCVLRLQTPPACAHGAARVRARPRRPVFRIGGRFLHVCITSSLAYHNLTQRRFPFRGIRARDAGWAGRARGPALGGPDMLSFFLTFSRLKSPPYALTPSKRFCPRPWLRCCPGAP